MKDHLAIPFLWAFCSTFTFVLAQETQQPPVVVSADKMNVLYVGIDNPISVAVPGYASDKVSATLSKSGTLTAVVPGKYIARVTEVDYKGEIKVQVYAEMPNGIKKLMGEVAFRAKRVPDPVVTIGGYKGGEIKTALFKVQKGVYVVLENFDFEVRFNVIEFEMTYVSSGNTSTTLSTTGPLFSKEMMDVIAQSKPGDKFFFDKVKVKGPDSTIRVLPSTVYYLI